MLIYRVETEDENNLNLQVGNGDYNHKQLNFKVMKVKLQVENNVTQEKQNTSDSQ